MRNFISIFILCLFCCTAIAGTANAKLFLSLYATGGEHKFSNTQNIDPGTLSGFKVSLDFEGGEKDFNVSLEGSYNQISTINPYDGEPLDATIPRVDLIYPLTQKTKWRPFLTVGYGKLSFDSDDTRLKEEDVATYGVGLKYLVTEYLTLRAEVRRELLFNREDGNTDNYEYTASVGYTFGKRKPRKKKPKPKPEPIPEPIPEPVISDDDDLDGVKNPVDRCPGTPAGIKVDSSGCAEQTTGAPDSLLEEIIPAEEPAPIEEEVIVATIPEPTQEEVTPVVEQEDAPPAFVLPSLPTIIAFPAIIPALPVIGAIALADAITGDKAETTEAPPEPETAVSSSSIPMAPQPSIPVASPPVAAMSETPVTADAADPAAAAAQESSALPAPQQLPEPLPVPTVAIVEEPIAEKEPEIRPAPSSGEMATPPILVATPTEPPAQPAPKTVPLAIPECSGLPPHAILMLGKSGSDLLHVPVDTVQKEPEPFLADGTVAKKTHVPTASFDFDVWLLSPQAQQVLSLLVKQLQASELDFSIRVEGHTDSKGSDAYNYNLSVLRANAVATFLVDKKGLEPDKISIAGCGEWKPLASNKTDEGRSLNRRFELIILPSSGK